AQLMHDPAVRRAYLGAVAA
ncbi:MAG: hypothetical protein ACREO8_03225, partial [Luteimonas sp.]